jgi:hypothetical protein
VENLPTKLHKNIPIGSKVDRETDRQADRRTDSMVISLAYIFPLEMKLG